MNQEQIEHAIDEIDDFLKENYPNIVPEQAMGDFKVQQKYAHLKYMVSIMHELAEKAENDQEAKEKLMRWLGFAQGTLWTTKHFTVNQLREMNTGKV